MATADYTITRDELKAELDRQARAALDISGSEFLERYRTGDLDSTSGAVAHLSLFARLLTQRPKSS